MKLRWYPRTLGFSGVVWFESNLFPRQGDGVLSFRRSLLDNTENTCWGKCLLWDYFHSSRFHILLGYNTQYQLVRLITSWGINYSPSTLLTQPCELITGSTPYKLFVRTTRTFRVRIPRNNSRVCRYLSLIPSQHLRFILNFYIQSKF